MDGFNALLSSGQLTLLRRGWFNKTFSLPVGKHSIGRKDAELPSEISVGDDPSMSRQSAEIEVIPSGNGFFYTFTVLHAVNPVLHNGNELVEGECVSLNFGDTIQMGRTKFRFDKDGKGK